MENKFDSPAYMDADDIAEYYWAIQVESDPKVHPSLQNDYRKLRITLNKWAKEFYKLIIKHHPPYEEIERVIRFVYHTKYYSQAKYSAGYLCSKYIQIRELMERMEFEPLMPQF